MSYLETPTRHITVNNQKIAYRELGEGKSDMPLVMLVTSLRLWMTGTPNCLTCLLSTST